MTPYELVVGKLEAAGLRRGGQFLCPAHDDHHPSLSVDPGRTPDGSETALIYCHAGCGFEAILAALGLEPADLYGRQPARRRERWAPIRREAWLALPPTSGSLFGLACCYGRLLLSDGGFAPANSGRQVIASELGKRAQQRLREETGISAAKLRRLVYTWRTAGLAHRCDRDRLLLFMAPTGVCPGCGERLQSVPQTAVSRAQPFLRRTSGAPERSPDERSQAREASTPSSGSTRVGVARSPAMDVQVTSSRALDGLRALEAEARRLRAAGRGPSWWLRRLDDPEVEP